MYGLALYLPSGGQPQGLPVPREIPKNQNDVHGPVLPVEGCRCWGGFDGDSVGIVGNLGNNAFVPFNNGYAGVEIPTKHFLKQDGEKVVLVDVGDELTLPLGEAPAGGIGDVLAECGRVVGAK